MVFQDLDLGSAHFWLNRFEIQAFWKCLEFGFGMNLGLSDEFEVRRLLYLGLIQSKTNPYT